jgi:hypothetical protein
MADFGGRWAQKWAQAFWGIIVRVLFSLWQNWAIEVAAPSVKGTF